MRTGSISISLHDDGRRRLEVFASGDLFRYTIDVWGLWPVDHPVAEHTTGYWSEEYNSGFYDSAEAAMSDALVSHFGLEVQHDR